MFSQSGLEIRIKWTSNYLDAQSLGDTLLEQSSERLRCLFISFRKQTGKITRKMLKTKV